MECRYSKGHSPNKIFLFYRQGVAFPPSLTIIPHRQRISELQGVAFTLAFSSPLPFSNIHSFNMSSNHEHAKRTLIRHKGLSTDVGAMIKELTVTQQA